MTIRGGEASVFLQVQSSPSAWPIVIPWEPKQGKQYREENIRKMVDRNQKIVETLRGKDY